MSRIVQIATLLVLAFGVFAALRFVGPERLARDADAIAFDDYALQFYYGDLGGRFLREGGRWLYHSGTNPA